MSSDLLEDLRKATRRAIESGTRDVVDELDLAAMLVDPNHGGLGMGDREIALVAGELGAAVSPSAFLPTAVLAPTLLAFVDNNASALLVSLPDTRYAVALDGLNGARADHVESVSASRSADGGWRLSGTATGLTASAHADAVLVLANGQDGVALHRLEGAAGTLTPAEELDSGRGLVEIALDEAPSTMLAGPAMAVPAAEAAYRRALIALSAEQVGIARSCLHTTVEYAKTRTQFGAPIGSFQAVKHRCTDVLLDTELAESVVHQAIESEARPDAELAFVLGTRAAVLAAETCIHVHGGIGFTWEHSAHRYLRRARVNATLLGPPGLHRDAIAESAGINRI
ncbi:acyl-CoA/acyl-ACP dehydrogenase [Mycobacterium sp. CVI_P3]|uniref:Acyl-CoA/acyl-ACP dehydrogenase n=1 Tax=Mycobacterium pinniadriaticum TaxID=2994102 RepID=A0ABT3SBY8_9MYCO|nr:acyl-CoA dehydrogenase family protein [Mycobacterium pinniadriaticum]MCX2930612.1 acyl-CoA/acyl-ACP dehydrogenase [Mycobacterium pinniadriaticum]MCX2937036.1 acyl-CoA/acyl-ACP dehydrogenase [Mycobacterium pinniadriaticum]